MPPPTPNDTLVSPEVEKDALHLHDPMQCNVYILRHARGIAAHVYPGAVLQQTPKHRRLLKHSVTALLLGPRK